MLDILLRKLDQSCKQCKHCSHEMLKLEMLSKNYKFVSIYINTNQFFQQLSNLVVISFVISQKVDY